MNREYRYSDAVRLLGGTAPVVKELDTLLSAGTLGLWDLIEAKNELVKVGGDLLGRWSEWRAGDAWRSRTERIEAAHTVLVYTALFEAVDDLDLSSLVGDLRLIKREMTEQDRRNRVQARSDAQEALDDLRTPPCPSPHSPYEVTKKKIGSFYQAGARHLLKILPELAGWDRLTAQQRDRACAALRMLPSCAVARYEDAYRRLAQDVQEFGFWTGMVDHQATRASLAGLECLLSTIASGQAPTDRLQALRNVHKAALRRPVAELGDMPVGLRLPTLEEAYISQRFRAGEIEHGDNPGVESWWEGKEQRDDLPAFLAAFLTQSRASRVPLIVLGQPGAGKSVLTKVLGARLPSAFLPIRVPLREVSASDSIQEQIEKAIQQATGEMLSWPSLVRSLGGRLPVVILDGFDELLQATGVKRSDYLAKVARFQEREGELGSAVAVIVTSRTAVAHFAAPQLGTVMVRLEPFDDVQIRRWLEVWNTVNASYFVRQKVQSFAPERALAHPDLAGQPLLLLMLAVYDADGNPLDRAMSSFGQTELYEQLMISFARRELAKAHPADQLDTRVEEWLERLAFVAFSMFNRRSRWVTAEQVTDDFLALGRAQPSARSFETPLSDGERIFGSFFFLHEVQAVRNADRLKAYEFVHATFGEFLIARLVAGLLDEMARRPPGRLISTLDDTLLRALLSWAALSSYAPVVEFLWQLARRSDAKPWHAVVARLFHELDDRSDMSPPHYRPQPSNPARRYAYYTANLLVLAVTTADRVFASDLLPGREDAPTEWERYFYLWKSQCAKEEWESQVRVVTLIPSKREGAWDHIVKLYRGPRDDRVRLVPPESRGQVGPLSAFTQSLPIATSLPHAGDDAGPTGLDH
ncbi:NACHT domain-containing protein [Nonomuraea rhodomycinica]|uniref:NACHT N-terminal Helical domain-containing protein n=1 Tax=Nonomuraea rhodomycinica TaxID=1712872 RepID=A0A7Y6MAG7_9ACTN|nr:hypothetical protein [Nonomuraea rhodomycinica]NUW40652.1 hypothetical protein [Nonomuraea rhodomycinica]